MGNHKLHLQSLGVLVLFLDSQENNFFLYNLRNTKQEQNLKDFPEVPPHRGDTESS